MLKRREYLHGLAAALCGGAAWAQTAAMARYKTWPQQPVNLIVPFPAGGASAILAKALAQAFEQTTQHSLHLKYLGGGGLQGASFAAKAAGNGSNLFIGGSYLAMTRALSSADAFDFLEDLHPLAMVAKVPLVVVVNPERVRSRTAMEWLADLSRKPMRYRMATAGVGSSSHIAAEMLKQQESLQFEFVHFRGSGPALQDVLAGSVDMMIDGLISCLPHIRAGRLKALVVSGDQRVSVLPQVPCAQEMGIAALEVVTWYGLFAPSDLPAAQAQQMVITLQRMGQNPTLNAKLQTWGVHWADIYGEAFAALVQQDTVQWAQRIKNMGLRQLWQKNYQNFQEG